MQESTEISAFVRCWSGSRTSWVVVTFLAILELMKIGKIHLTQEHAFDDMYIEIQEAEGEETELLLEDLGDLEG